MTFLLEQTAKLSISQDSVFVLDALSVLFYKENNVSKININPKLNKNKRQLIEESKKTETVEVINYIQNILNLTLDDLRKIYVNSENEFTPV